MYVDTVTNTVQAQGRSIACVQTLLSTTEAILAHCQMGGISLGIMQGSKRKGNKSTAARTTLRTLSLPKL